MKLLLDTHAVIWFGDGSDELSDAAAAAIGDPANDVLISAVVAWEIAIKRGVGKLIVQHDYVNAMLAAGARELPVTVAHAQAVERLPLRHRDPFDRLLIAQAREERAVLITADPRIAGYEVEVLW